MGATDYIVSARKYRPSTFESVVGQKWLTATLKNAIQSGKLAHSYLFCGPRGVGKTTCARIFAKTINCQHLKENGEACGECESCRSFNEELRSYNVFELDAASNNSVEDIRQLTEQVRIPPMTGTYKVYVIDEVHMLSTAAFNAFLKTLEEPPKYAIFILATTEKQKIIPTILSRCQVFDFQRITNQDIADHLKYVAESENIKYEPEALSVIAEKADGGMRDALSIFDQVASFTHNNITYAETIQHLNVIDTQNYFSLTDHIIQQDIPQSLILLNNIINKGFDPGIFISGLLQHFRNLLMCSNKSTVELLETSDELKKRYSDQASKLTPKYLYRAIKLCCDCDLNYKASKNRRLLVELTLIQLAQAMSEPDAPVSGLGPTRITIQPIFNKVSEQKVQKQVLPEPDQAPARNHSTAKSDSAVKSDSTVKNDNTVNNETPKVAGNRLFVSINGGGSNVVRKTSTKIVQPQQTETQDTTQEYTPIYKPHTQDMLDIYWRELAEKIGQKDIALMNRMYNSVPVFENTSVIRIPVLNPLVQNEINAHSETIQSEFKKIFGPETTIQVIVSNNTKNKAIKTAYEQLEEMRASHPALKQMEEKFQLTL